MDSFVEDEEYRQHKADEGSEVIPAEMAVEGDHGENGKHRERDAFLDDLQLHQIKRAAVSDEADAIGWHHETVFQKGDAPGKEHNGVDGPSGEVDGLDGLQFEMQVPGTGHEDIGNEKQSDGKQAFA